MPKTSWAGDNRDAVSQIGAKKETMSADSVALIHHCIMLFFVKCLRIVFELDVWMCLLYSSNVQDSSEVQLIVKKCRDMIPHVCPSRGHLIRGRLECCTYCADASCFVAFIHEKTNRGGHVDDSAAPLTLSNAGHASEVAKWACMSTRKMWRSGHSCCMSS